MTRFVFKLYCHHHPALFMVLCVAPVGCILVDVFPKIDNQSINCCPRQVMKPNLAIEKVSYMERENLWIGPRQADLIHMGAKYSPCMRKDANVERLLDDARSTESRTACCVRNDGSGCLQTEYEKCSVSVNLNILFKCP